MESWCRICGRNDEEFRRFPLFSVADVSQEVIAKMITSCTDMQVSSDDGLPQQICPDCLITLSLAYSFQRLCRRTDAKFRETFEARASAEHMATGGGGNQARRSQSQVGLEEGAAYEAVPVIKEEVEFYDYECSAPPPPLEDQWVIQNPRTIHEGAVTASGAMTVLHNIGQYQDGGGGSGELQQQEEDEMSSMLPMVSMEEGDHDPAEYGESSGSGQRKQKKIEPERFSKRIRRQESPALHDGTAGADPSHFLVAMPDPSGDGLLEEIITSDGQQLVINPAKQLQRCEYCRKKMKKPYKHRNGKCMEAKKVLSRPRCPYCHIVFVRSTSIPLHVQNSCRVYRELCATSQELPEQEETKTEGITAPPPVKVKNNSKTVDLKPILQKSKTKTNLICRYCYMTFLKRANLLKHQRDKCRVLNEHDVERLATYIAESAAADTTVKEPEPEPEAPSQDGEEAEETTCIYCTQLVSKKTRFQHHNGRCVLGRANADHPCPYCEAAYSSRSNLLRHQREHCQKYQEEHGTDLTLTNKFEGLPVEGDTSRDETILNKTPTSSSSSKPEKKPKPPKAAVVKQRKKPKEAPVKSPAEPANFVCSYCRKGYAMRDSLIEHQRSCTARKQHKQVKCQFCGMVISNRGNLRKHQKQYCKRAPRENAMKEEPQDSIPEPKTAKVTKPLKKVKKEKLLNDSLPADDPPKDPLEESVPMPPIVHDNDDDDDDDEPVQKKVKRRGRHNKIPCRNCDREFQNHRQLKNHERLCVKSRKMYKCKYCPASFTHPSNMHRHMRLKRCPTGVNAGGRDSACDSLENGFQSDSSNLLSSTMHEPEPEPEPAEGDFEMILPENSQECILPERAESVVLMENNNAQQLESTNKERREPAEEDKAPEPEGEELVPPEAILYTEEVELQDQPPTPTTTTTDRTVELQP